MKQNINRSILAVLCLVCWGMPSMAQSSIEAVLSKSIKQGVVLLRQDYQVLDDNDEAFNNRPGKDYYGRTYTCGIRIGEDNLLVERSFVRPWVNDTSVPKGNKYHKIVSFSAYMELNSKEPEQLDTEVESATPIVENHAFTVSGSEQEGFEIDNQFGKKTGYAAWLVSSTSFVGDQEPGNLSLRTEPLSITTQENKTLYDISNQPAGNVIGGFFLVPSTKKVGEITLRVNGIFEKIGGIWKLVSFGTDEPDND